MIRAIHIRAAAKAQYAWLYRHHFPPAVRRHCAVDGLASSAPGHAELGRFLLGVRRVLDQVRRDHADQNVLLVSSGYLHRRG